MELIPLRVAQRLEHREIGDADAESPLPRILRLQKRRRQPLPEPTSSARSFGTIAGAAEDGLPVSVTRFLSLLPSHSAPQIDYGWSEGLGHWNFDRELAALRSIKNPGLVGVGCQTPRVQELFEGLVNGSGKLQFQDFYSEGYHGWFSYLPLLLNQT
jgi:hypothetical protein